MASFTVSLERLHDDAAVQIAYTQRVTAEFIRGKTGQIRPRLPTKLAGYSALDQMVWRIRNKTDFAFGFDRVMSMLASKYEQMKEKKHKRRTKNRD